jgi:hypothetical protein
VWTPRRLAAKMYARIGTPEGNQRHHWLLLNQAHHQNHHHHHEQQQQQQQHLRTKAVESDDSRLALINEAAATAAPEIDTKAAPSSTPAAGKRKSLIAIVKLALIVGVLFAFNRLTLYQVDLVSPDFPFHRAARLASSRLSRAGPTNRTTSFIRLTSRLCALEHAQLCNALATPTNRPETQT